MKEMVTRGESLGGWGGGQAWPSWRFLVFFEFKF